MRTRVPILSPAVLLVIVAVLAAPFLSGDIIVRSPITLLREAAGFVRTLFGEPAPAEPREPAGSQIAAVPSTKTPPVSTLDRPTTRVQRAQGEPATPQPQGVGGDLASRRGVDALPGSDPGGVSTPGLQLPSGIEVPAELSDVPPANIQPPTVQPPAVQPPAVQPPAVQPPAVQPPAVQPPSVQPPAVQPPAVQPPSVQPPAVQPPGAPPGGVSPGGPAGPGGPEIPGGILGIL